MAIVVFGVGQLVLPPLAEHIARQRLAKHGGVLSVSVSAFPAIELLWGDADSVKVAMSTYTADQSQVASNITQADGVSNLHVSIGQVSSGLLKVSDVTVTKRGRQITAAGHVSEANLKSIIPILQSVTPVSSRSGQLTLAGTTDNLPIIGSVSAEATVSAEKGQVTVAGAGLLGSLLHFTVWSNPHISVESITGRAANQGLSLTARARLH